MPANIVKRGTAKRIEDFYSPELDSQNKTYAFDFKNSIDLIEQAINNGEHITIVGDYDADGISATAILKLALSELGADVSYILPLRFTEGYSIKPGIVDRIDEGLVITVDNGIAALEAIQLAKDKGLSVLIIDHHLPVMKNNEIVLPNADCIINPHVEDVAAELAHSKQTAYGYVDYCGAGLALKVSERLLEGKEYDPELIDRLYAFAAIATVADVMPMTGDNRNIFIRGTGAIVDGKTTDGLYVLVEENGIDIHSLPAGLPPYALITDYTCGFKLGPCFNGLSRLYDDGATRALKTILVDGNPERARRLVGEMIEANEKRKDIVEKEMALIDKVIRDNKMENDCPIIVYLPESGRGIMGLDAGKLTERYVTPSIVICGEDEICHGSCRSPEGIDMKAMLDCGQEIMKEKGYQGMLAYGGHKGAAGITIRREEIPVFREELMNLCSALGIHSLKTDDVFYDLSIRADDVAHNIDYIYQHLAPFGNGNPEPVFMIEDFQIDQIRLMGSNKQHIKLTDPNGVSAIAFNGAEHGIPEGIAVGNTICVMGTLGVNIFRGEAYPQISVQLFCDENHRELTVPEQQAAEQENQQDEPEL